MNILVVDNKQNELNHTVKCLKFIYPNASLISFDDAMDAVRYGYNYHVDILYTEVIMHHITGFDVARLIRQKQPDVKVCFISNTEKYLNLSIKNKGKGYYLKPINTETLLYGNRINSSI